MILAAPRSGLRGRVVPAGERAGLGEDAVAVGVAGRVDLSAERDDHELRQHVLRVTRRHREDAILLRVAQGREAFVLVGGEGRTVVSVEVDLPRPEGLHDLALEHRGGRSGNRRQRGRGGDGGGAGKDGATGGSVSV